MAIQHFFKFADEAAARSALPTAWTHYSNGDFWHGNVDGPIDIYHPVETSHWDDDFQVWVQDVELTPGYHLNIVESALVEDWTSLTELLGARIDGLGDFVYGDKPQMPKQIFSSATAPEQS